MAEGFLNYDRKKIKKLLYVHLSILLLFTVLFGVWIYYNYNAGYHTTEQGPHSRPFLMPLLFVPLLLLSALAYFIVLFKLGIKYFLPSIFFFIVSILLSHYLCLLLPDMPVVKGYYNYIKDNAKLDDIHKWLTEYKVKDYESVYPDGSKLENIAQDDWPDCIKVLNPHTIELFERNSKKYVRISYDHGHGLSFGLCVAQEGTIVPLDDYCESEHRLVIQDNFFVWFE